jgi:hypothetical protein
MHQFMRQIVQDKLVAFDYTTREWQWSLEKLDAVSYPQVRILFVNFFNSIALVLITLSSL